MYMRLLPRKLEKQVIVMDQDQMKIFLEKWKNDQYGKGLLHN